MNYNIHYLTQEERDNLILEFVKFWQWMNEHNKNFQVQRKKYLMFEDGENEHEL